MCVHVCFLTCTNITVRLLFDMHKYMYKVVFWHARIGTYMCKLGFGMHICMCKDGFWHACIKCARLGFGVYIYVQG